jgi:puromycin-sensitive aminopeptidase
LTIRVPPGVVALGNGVKVSDEPDGALRAIRFEQTAPVSSYLIALVVGRLQVGASATIAGVAIQTWCRPEKSHLALFGQEAAVAVLPRLEAYFGIPYAFGKVDQVAVPDFAAGAMENVGLIIFREVALLLDVSSAPRVQQKRVAEIVAHELAHHWFGNLVTMAWWDDLWLNEAFATWIACKIVDEWKPDWRIWLDFHARKAMALYLDALGSTHPIRSEVHSAAAAGENFDVITYEKGCAVLRMLEGFLGQDAFREGIRIYMKRYAYGNAVAADLWTALSEASSQPVPEVAVAWILQSGYPVIEVSLDGDRIVLRQRRFYSEPGTTSGELWPVPMVLRYFDGVIEHERRFLLRDDEAGFTLPGGKPPEWLCANAGSTGFYRVAYSPALLHGLASHAAALSASERVALLADTWALARAGEASLDSFLTLVESFGAEVDEAVLDELVARLLFVEARIAPAGDRAAFQGFVRSLLEPALEQLGLRPRPGQTDRDGLRRAVLVRGVGVVGRSCGLRAELLAPVQAQLAGDRTALEPDLAAAALTIVARAGDDRMFDALVALSVEELDPAIQRRYLMALTVFEDDIPYQRAVRMLLDGQVPMQDVAMFVSGLLANQVGRESFWRTLQDNWGAVLARAGNTPIIVRQVVDALGQLSERRQLDELVALLETNPMPGMQQTVARTLERLTQDLALRDRVQGQLTAWLSQR